MVYGFRVYGLGLLPGFLSRVSWQVPLGVKGGSFKEAVEGSPLIKGAHCFEGFFFYGCVL